MRKFLSILTVAVTVSVAFVFSIVSQGVSAQDTSARQVSSIRVILVGDSTMAARNGYGDALCARFNSAVTCLNLAKNGRSSKSYRVEGFWQKVMQQMIDKEFSATYVLIQFGHNDQPGKAERSTTLPEFAKNLERYVTELRAAGAIPILVTPLTRRKFKEHRVSEDLKPWAQVTRKVAKDNHVALLDLNSDSVQLVQRLGAEQSLTLSQVPPSKEIVAAARAGTTIEAPKKSSAEIPAFDYTHLGAHGAQVFSAVVAKELRRAVPRLQKYL